MEPKVWEPIFGTEGSAEAWRWDGAMFHPAITAPPGTNTYTATFEAELIDMDSGTSLPGTGTGPFELNWTTVPDGRPDLQIAQKIVVSCPATTNFVLEATETLNPSAWVTVTNTPVLLDGQTAVVLDPVQATRYFRMKRLP